jgi:hypothetical protein
MKRSLTFALGGIVLAGMLALGSVLPAASQPVPAPVVGEYFAQDSTDKYFDDASSPLRTNDYGDSLLIRGPIFETSSGDRVGNYYLTLDTITPRLGLGHGRLTVQLPGGQIVSEGMFNLNQFQPPDRTPQTLAVVGGTGDYARARGSVTTEFLDTSTGITYNLFMD